MRIYGKEELRNFLLSHGWKRDNDYSVLRKGENIIDLTQTAWSRLFNYQAGKNISIIFSLPDCRFSEEGEIQSGCIYVRL